MNFTAKINEGGKLVDVAIPVSLYRDAYKADMSVPQYVNTTLFPAADTAHGTAFEQICASTGLFMASNKDYAVRSPTLEAVFDGTAGINAAGITRDSTPASRILFPAVFLEYIENKLAIERTSQPAAFEKMVAISDTVSGGRIEQPVLNFSNAENIRSRAVAQLALPNSMLQITAADVTRKIPTVSMGMEISAEALRTVTIDLTALAIARQVEVERDLRVEEYISAFVNGDVDNGSSALVATTSTSLDAAATGGVLTHKAWIKWLAQNRRKRKIDWVVCDINAALAIELRTGRPTVLSTDSSNAQYNSIASPVNLGIQDVNLFIVEVGVIAAGTVLGIDSRYAIRRIRNSEADYQAAENFVMNKSTAMRFDFGEIAYRLFDEAFDVLTIS